MSIQTNSSLKNLPNGQPPFQVGQRVSTNYYANVTGEYVVDSVTFAGSGTTYSNYRVSASPAPGSNAQPIGRSIDASWFFPVSAPVAVAAPTPAVQVTPATVSAKSFKTSATLAKLNAERNALMAELRKTPRNTEKHLALLTVSNKVATEVAKLLAK